jgi:hypothetical protein
MAITVNLSAYAANGGAPLTYSAGTTYVNGDVVVSSGVKYKCKATSTGNTPATGANTWWVEIVEKTIGSASRDYPSITAWIAAFPAFNDTVNQIWKGILYKEGGGTNGEWVTSPDFSSKGGTANQFPWLEPASGQGFIDSATVRTTALRYNNANGVAISGTPGGNNTSQVFLRGLQINGRLNLSGSGTTFSVVDCIINWTANLDQFSHLHMTNCAITSTPTSGNLIRLSPPGTCSAVNCTFLGGGGTSVAIASGYSSKWLLRGNAFFNYSANISASGVAIANSNYNATNLAAMGWTGTGNVLNLTTSNQFESSSAPLDLRVKAGSGLINAGARYQTDTGDVDISRFARSTSTPTIGAWEYGVTAYTLNVNNGSFTTAGQSVREYIGRRLTGNNGTYTSAGYTARLTPGSINQLNVQNGTFSVSGQPVTFLYGRRMDLSAGSYATSGQSASLAAARKLNLSQGPYSTAGNTASLKVDRRLGLGQGTYTTAGNGIDSSTAKTLYAQLGLFSISGQAASLNRSRTMNLSGGSYATVGRSVTLDRVGATLYAGTGAFGVSGSRAALNYSGAPDYRNFAPVGGSGINVQYLPVSL